MLFTCPGTSELCIDRYTSVGATFVDATNNPSVCDVVCRLLYASTYVVVRERDAEVPAAEAGMYTSRAYEVEESASRSGVTGSSFRTLTLCGLLDATVVRTLDTFPLP